MSKIVWSGKAYMKKTVIKFALIFIITSLLLIPIFILLDFFKFGFIVFALWCLTAGLYFIGYYFNKKAYTFYVTEKAVRIEKSWVFGTYQREITLDQIRDIHINQGILARHFNCGNLLLVTTTGLEVGYAHTGTGVGAGTGVLVGGGAGTSVPELIEERGNTFWDIPNPGAVRELLVGKLTEWREAFQQQRIAVSLEKIAEMPQPTSAPLVTALEKLKALFDEGAITKEEYKKAKKKLLE